MNHEDVDYPDYHYQGMGCGLEDRGIADRYEAMPPGWDEAIERCSSEVVDPLLARINELEEMLKWYIEEDEINEGDPDNQYWIDGKHRAMKLLGMEIEE